MEMLGAREVVGTEAAVANLVAVAEQVELVALAAVEVAVGSGHRRRNRTARNFAVTMVGSM